MKKDEKLNKKQHLKALKLFFHSHETVNFNNLNDFAKTVTNSYIAKSVRFIAQCLQLPLESKVKIRESLKLNTIPPTKKKF